MLESVALSLENRFDAAYKAIMQCAMIGLWANGLTLYLVPLSTRSCRTMFS